MAKYAFNNLLGGTQQNLSSSFKTINYIVATTGATTLRRGYVDEFNFGQDGAPNSTNCTVVWSVDRTTADGTGTAAQAIPVDNQDAAALLTYKANYTAEPTVTANTTLLGIAMNQQDKFRWKVFDQKDMLIIPATNLAGIVTRAKSATFAATVVGGGFCSE